MYEGYTSFQQGIIIEMVLEIPQGERCNLDGVIQHKNGDIKKSIWFRDG